jgi:glycosyltransferase involved in cell wall biosynthesis
MTIKISVIIPTYNHARYVSLAIESVLAQTLSPHQIIVVDDGSKDKTEEILADYQDKVIYVKQENQGVAAARNNGVEKSNGDYVAFLDADDEWFPQKLEKQVTVFERGKEIGLVHCGYVDIDREGNLLQEHIEGMFGSVAKEMLFFERPVILGGGSGILIPRAIFEDVGGFDSRLSTSADWDLYFRIAQKWKVGFVPEVLLKYRLHESNMHGNIKLMRKDMLLAYQKAFGKNEDSELKKVRRKAYGRLHAVLAGSFYTVGQYEEIFPHILKSILFSPASAVELLKLPFRFWKLIYRRNNLSQK